MSLFAIGDPHLSFGSQKPMNIFKGWENHAQRLEENWRMTGKKDLFKRKPRLLVDNKK